jgi:hypothetical protein
MIRDLIDTEFRKKINHQTTILRQNSMVSKMMGKYTKMIGTNYLRFLLTDLVEDLYQKESLVLDINPK